MSRQALVEAFNLLAEAAAKVAIELEASEPSAARADVAPSAPVAGAGAPPPAPRRSDSAFTECPAHNKPWTDGKFGAYCTSASEDPEWSNDKGYCRVTPRSAGAWLRQHPRTTVTA